MFQFCKHFKNQSFFVTLGLYLQFIKTNFLDLVYESNNGKEIANTDPSKLVFTSFILPP